MSELAIRGGRVIDPASGRDEIADILIKGDRIAEVGSGLKAVDTIDAAGLWVVPGLIDMHVHMREPGGEVKETIRTAAAAAAAGGFAAVLAMPNTAPAVDKGYLVKYILSEGREARGAEVLVAAALSEQRLGERPANLSGLARAGAVAFTDDGDEVRDSRLMLACMKEAARLGLPVLVHAEEPSLVEGGVMNEGGLATKLGLAGRPAIAEQLAVVRDLLLAAEAGCHVHVQHVSVAGALRAIANAKGAGQRVSCEATPHHLVLNELACAEYDTNAKVNPPLRCEADRRALVKAAADGTVDALATDHAPHTAEEKALEFDAAPSGMIGLETAVGIVMTELVGPNVITPGRFVELLSRAPARILGLTDGGHLAPGAKAHVTVIDPKAEWTVDPSAMKSKARNTPFAGRALRGRAAATIVDGRVAFALS
jgi:dihydroorotase